MYISRRKKKAAISAETVPDSKNLTVSSLAAEMLQGSAVHLKGEKQTPLIHKN